MALVLLSEGSPVPLASGGAGCSAASASTRARR